MKKSVVFFALFVLVASPVFSQQGLFGLHFGSSRAHGKFDEVSRGLQSWGMNLEGAYQVPNTPILIGVSGYYGLYDSHLDKSTYLDNSGQTMRVRTNHNHIQANAFVRLQPELDWPVHPYVEGIAGMNWLYTREKIRPRLFDEVFDASSLYGSSAFFYGAGGGIMIPIPETIVRIDLRAQYLRGGRAEYLLQSDIQWDPVAERLQLNPRNSITDMLSFRLGVQIYLD
jgi:hypothetical protein